MIDLMTGNVAAAKAAMLAGVEVVAAYPITPQTSISEKLAEMVANDEIKAKYIKVESEHSAMAALIGASYMGARTFTATSSQGLALMHEMLFWAAGARRPIVMTVVSRSLGPPWNIWTDHMDVIGERDTGWMQFFCENNQEALDLILLAYKVAEDKEVMLPTMVIEDGFILSHTFEKVDIPAKEEVDFFLPPFNPDVKVNFRKPRRYGSLVMPDWTMEFRYNNYLAMEKAKKKFAEAGSAFSKAFGRDYSSLIESYRCEGAEAVLIITGSAAGTAKVAADRMRERGKKVGVAKMRVFRPFPNEELLKLAENVRTIGVFDRSYTFGYGGAIYSEVRNALFSLAADLKVKGYIGGLGGRDVTETDFEKIFDDLLTLRRSGLASNQVDWVGLKDGSMRW
ncbi:MAG: transketolase C-terminal domain-containing protein [Methanomassiliicoccales archaeon]